ncbi:MAG: glycosyltransferase, partial [Candidatus Cloacimonetes bacterium]|nr:glycosyltransferase [Candidatus Cloacimonadota bacterium]
MQELQDKLIGFVIPAKDEAPTLRELYNGIAFQCENLKVRFEVIFVDDGSKDNTWDVMQALADEFPHTVRSVKLRNNVGKARALATGFQFSRSDITFTMDADLQDDPVEIPRFLVKLHQG